MKKLLITPLIILTVISLFSFSCLAADETEKAIDETLTETAEENFFESIYVEFLKHSDKLFSALTFLASILVIFAYKKGLIPIIKASLGALSTAVSSLKEENERAGIAANDAILSASEKLGSAENLIIGLAERLDGIEKQLDEACEKSISYDTVYTVIRGQIDMLYEVFMSSSLPAYQKEAVGERITEMKRSISSFDKAVNKADE